MPETSFYAALRFFFRALWMSSTAHSASSAAPPEAIQTHRGVEVSSVMTKVPLSGIWKRR